MTQMLEYLLNPIPISSFVADYWDKAPFYILRKKRHYYDDILTIEQVNEYLSKNDIRFPSVNIAKKDYDIPLTDYSNVLSIGKYASEGLIDIDKLFDKFNNGASVFLQRMRSSIDSLASFVSQLEKELKFRIETHLFLTPENSQALSEHYDTTSSFIMQIYGTKTWIVSKPILELPAIDQIFNNTTYEGSDKIFEVTLHPGDLLFLPRGFIHQAKTSSDMSLHITTIFYPITWLDIFDKLIENLKDNREFRKSSIKTSLSESSKSDFLFLKKQLKEGSNYKNIFVTLKETSQTRQVKDNSDRVNDYLHLSQINQQSILSRRKNINYEIIRTDKSVSLNFYGKKIEFPLFVFDELKYIAEQAEFSIANISNRIDDNGKLVLSRKLIKEGFLKIINL